MSSGTTDIELGANLCNHKEQGVQVPQIPPHWIFEEDERPSTHSHPRRRPFIHFLHYFFCVVGLGHASLRDFWEVSYPGCPVEV